MRVTGLRRMPMIGVAIAMAIALSACAPTDPEPTPTPSSTAIFATEDDALQAAIDVYQKYSAAMDEVANSASNNTEPVEPYVTPDFYAVLKEAAASRDSGNVSTGTTTFDTVSLVSLSQDADSASVHLALCLDSSDVDVINADGNDVRSADSDYRAPLEIVFEWDPSTEQLLVDDEGSWQGDDFC